MLKKIRRFILEVKVLYFQEMTDRCFKNMKECLDNGEEKEAKKWKTFANKYIVKRLDLIDNTIIKELA